MNKKEWRVKFSTARALYTAALRIGKYHNTPARLAALKIAWGIVEEYGMRTVFDGRQPYYFYPIAQCRWAIRSNYSNY